MQHFFSFVEFLDFLTENATLVGNGLNTIKRIASANGAYYATAANAEP